MAINMIKNVSFFDEIRPLIRDFIGAILLQRCKDNDIQRANTGNRDEQYRQRNERSPHDLA